MGSRARLLGWSDSLTCLDWELVGGATMLETNQGKWS